MWRVSGPPYKLRPKGEQKKNQPKEWKVHLANNRIKINTEKKRFRWLSHRFLGQIPSYACAIVICYG